MFSADTFYSQMIEGLKRNLAQNKDIYMEIHRIKTSQEIFQKEIGEKISGIMEKVNQLITPEDSYWKVSLIVAKYCDA
jgi:hypothetical protein